MENKTQPLPWKIRFANNSGIAIIALMILIAVYAILSLKRHNARPLGMIMVYSFPIFLVGLIIGIITATIE